jgi:flagellar biosynthetic protein FlhB
MVLGLVGGAAQVGGGLSLKAIAPKFSRISPKEGFKRLFSAQTSFALAKQVAKLAVLGVIGYRAIYGLMHTVPSTVPIGTATSIGLAGGAILAFVRQVAIFGFAVGVADYLFQRHRLQTALKMTKDEVKEENRQQQGDPTMKAQLRRRGYQIARSRVLAATRNADVVVANPSHFAVALQYDAVAGGAPRVVAKGSDGLALRMRAEAGQYRVPVVEDPPLARYLYAACEIGQQIPGEIYVAVARLLAFVYSLPESIRGVMVHQRAHSDVPVDPGASAGLASTRRSFQADSRERVGANR